MKFNREEYARQCRIVRNTPLYRASCPPEDELASLRDSAIEQIAEDVIDEAIESPGYMSEMLIEVDYENTAFKEMVPYLCAMMSKSKGDSRMAYDLRMAFAEAMMDFIETRATEIAEGKVDE